MEISIIFFDQGSIGILGIDLTHARSPKLLFIDPHYAGQVGNLTEVARPPWCYWEDCDRYFQSGAFYNAVLPLHSRAVRRKTAHETVSSNSDHEDDGISVTQSGSSTGAFGIEVIESGCSGSKSANVHGIELIDSGSTH